MNWVLAFHGFHVKGHESQTWAPRLVWGRVSVVLYGVNGGFVGCSSCTKTAELTIFDFPNVEIERAASHHAPTFSSLLVIRRRRRWRRPWRVVKFPCSQFSYSGRPACSTVFYNWCVTFWYQVAQLMMRDSFRQYLLTCDRSLRC